jgi:hypothetical protein
MNLPTIGGQAERRLVAEHAVASILNQSAEIINAAPRILQAICESLGWDVGALCVDRQAQVMRCIDVWHAPTVEVPAFEQVCRQDTFPRGSGLPGRIWASESHAPASVRRLCQPVGRRVGVRAVPPAGQPTRSAVP